MSSEDVNDGVGRYASRTRVNRRVLTIEGDGTDSVSGSLDLNGKITRVILDPKDISCNANAATTGSLVISMDLSPTGSSTGYPYCDTLAALDVRTASNTALHFQTSEGGNKNADGGSTSGLHFTVSAPASSTTGGVVIDEAAPWSGLVCGKVTFTIATSNGTFAGGSFRLIVIHE